MPRFFILSFILLLTFCSCHSQNQEDKDISKPGSFPFKPIQYKIVDSEIKEKLLIPFEKDGLYGLANYAGETMLEPKFLSIKMIDLAFPFFWAGEMGKETLHNAQGEKVLSSENQAILYFETQFERFQNDMYPALEQIEKRTPAPRLLRIREKHKSYLPSIPAHTENSAAQVEADRPSRQNYCSFYISEHTKGKVQPYFQPDYEHLPSEHKSLTWFSYDNSFDSLTKVMTQDGLFTFLDWEGNPIIEPNYNCVPFKYNTIQLFGKNGFCALKHETEGWQTDFLFKSIEWTKNPNIFLGEIWRQKTADPKDGKRRVFFLIRKGVVQEVPENEEWAVMDSDYSIVTKTFTEPTYRTTYTLWDNNSWKATRELPTNKLYSFPYANGVDFQINNPKTHFLTLRGDTLPLPQVDNYSMLRDSVWYFKTQDTFGFLDQNFKEVFRVTADGLDKRGANYFSVRKGTLRGLVDFEGTYILPIEYKSIDVIEKHGWIIARKDNEALQKAEYGLFDLEGKPILSMGYSMLFPTGITLGNGMGIEVRQGKTHYTLTSDFEIIIEKNDANLILTKDFFKIQSKDKTVLEDFKDAKLPRIYTSYAILQGKTYAHIFKSNGQYITSLTGQSNQQLESLVNWYMRHQYDIGSAHSGILQMRDEDGKVYFARLEDGMVYGGS